MYIYGWYGSRLSSIRNKANGRNAMDMGVQKKTTLENSLVNMTGTFNEDVGRRYIHAYR
jgi:hypothetical protein